MLCRNPLLAGGLDQHPFVVFGRFLAKVSAPFVRCDFVTSPGDWRVNGDGVNFGLLTVQKRSLVCVGWTQVCGVA